MRKENIRTKYKDTQLFKENHTSVANRVRGNFKRTEICECNGSGCEKCNYKGYIRWKKQSDWCPC